MSKWIKDDLGRKTPCKWKMCHSVTLQICQVQVTKWIQDIQNEATTEK